MINDFKNFVITFGLIAFVFTAGSLSYQKNVQVEHVLAIKNEELEKAQSEYLVLQANQEELLKQQKIAQDFIEKALVVVPVQKKPVVPVATAPQQIPVQTPPPPQTPPPAKTKPVKKVVVKPSRQSKAS